MCYFWYTLVMSFMDSPLLNVLITDTGAKLNKKIEKKTFFTSKKISMIKTYDVESFACQKWLKIKTISELGPRCSQNQTISLVEVCCFYNQNSAHIVSQFFKTIYFFSPKICWSKINFFHFVLNEGLNECKNVRLIENKS